MSVIARNQKAGLWVEFRRNPSATKGNRTLFSNGSLNIKQIATRLRSFQPACSQ
jgi:hypothetical protein